MKGMKLLYDAYFKEIMNPETTPERLEAFLSLILKQNVKIRRILPTDNSRISDERYRHSNRIAAGIPVDSA